MANPEHLEILRQGADRWNAWRKENSAITPDFEGANLEGVNLETANLEGANLLKANLQEGIFNNVQFFRAYLYGALLQRAQLIGANFQKANLVGANLNGAVLHLAHLDEASLQGASFINANLKKAKLYEADLRNTNLEEANLNGADIRGANLEKANFNNASLQNVNFEGAFFVATELNGANLEKANLFGVKVKRSNFLKANLQEANLRNSLFFQARLEGADLRKAMLEGAKFTETSLARASLKDLYLFRVNFEGVNLEEANLKNVNLRKANLQKTNFRKANLNKADLHMSNLKGANLCEANLQGASLVKANLQGAQLERVNLQRANLTDADLWHALLNEAILINTNLVNTKMWDVDLRGAIFQEKDGDGSLELYNADFWGAKFHKTIFPSPAAMGDLRNAITINQQRGIIYLDHTQHIVDEPFIELPEEARKAKRNVLLVSMLCFIRCIPDMAELTKFTFFGNEISISNPTYINAGLMLVNIYFLFSFILSGWDTYKKWELRLTGSARKKLKDEESKDDPRFWFDKTTDQCPAYSDIAHRLKRIADTLKACRTITPKSQETALASLREQLEKIEATTPLLIHLTKKVWRHQRLVVARFVFDFGLPIIISLLAVLALATSSIWLASL